MPVEGCLDICTSSLIAGWVWDKADPARRLQVDIAIEGRPAVTLAADLYRDDLERVGIGDGRYVFRWNPDDNVDLGAEITVAVDDFRIVSYCGGSRGNGVLPISPPDLRERIAGTDNENWWDGSGARTVTEWQRALSLMGRDFRDYPIILDFGCGTGRALRHLAPRLTPDQRLIGAEVDHEQTAWVRQNYPRVVAVNLDNLPPSKIEPSSVDLIVSNSIFTHLPEDVGRAWLDELARILKAGGILITTVHGQKAIDYTLRWMAAKGDATECDLFKQNISARGFHYIAGKNSPAEEPLPDYYGSTFHDISYIRSEWTQFDILAWLPGFALAYQDTLMLRRK